jgi:phospholipid/cholesterol/gamma-HCH transport system substrate-binding protein
MPRVTKTSGDSPLLFYTLVFSGVLALFALWFFLHPKSPWLPHNYYFIAFEEIGDLKVGNVVNINGMAMGYVDELELTDSHVLTKIAVLASVKIPVNSNLHVANVGLMGERAVEITLGNSENYYAENSQIAGNFDMGSTTVGTLAIQVIKEMNGILDIISGVADTLLSEQRMEDYKRLKTKGNVFGNRVSRIANSAELSLTASVDSLIEAKDKVSEIMDSIKPDLDSAIENADSLQERIAVLGESLEKFKNSIALIAKRLEDGENTISLALDKNQNGDLRREMLKVQKDAELLMEKIKKNGLDLNVDIW